MEYNPGDATGGVPPVEPVPPTPYPPAPTSGLSTNTAAALAYVTIIPAIVFLVMEPYNKNPFIRFHAFQSIGLAVSAFVVHIILTVIPIIGWLLMLPVGLGFLILWIYTILKASKGEWFKLPLIGEFALNQSRSV